MTNTANYFCIKCGNRHYDAGSRSYKARNLYEKHQKYKRIDDSAKLSNGQIRIWCNVCETSTWHFKRSEKKYRRGFSPSKHSWFVCEVCNNKSPYFDSLRYQGQYMKEYKKENVRVTCPKCKGRFFYSYKLKVSKCKKCGFEIPLNAVIEI